MNVQTAREPHSNHATNGTWIDVTLDGSATLAMDDAACDATRDNHDLRFAVEIAPDGTATFKVRRYGLWSPPLGSATVVQQGAYGDGS